MGIYFGTVTEINLIHASPLTLTLTPVLHFSHDLHSMNFSFISLCESSAINIKIFFLENRNFVLLSKNTKREEEEESSNSNPKQQKRVICELNLSVGDGTDLRFGYTVEPPVQTTIVEDIHSETWKFRHI